MARVVSSKLINGFFRLNISMNYWFSFPFPFQLIIPQFDQTYLKAKGRISDCGWGGGMADQPQIGTVEEINNLFIWNNPPTPPTSPQFRSDTSFAGRCARLGLAKIQPKIQLCGGGTVGQNTAPISLKAALWPQNHPPIQGWAWNSIRCTRAINHDLFDDI